MGFLGRIGTLVKGAAQRIGFSSVHTAVNKIGAVSAGLYALGKTANTLTGGGVQRAADSILGQPLANAVGGGIRYLGKTYAQAQAVQAAAPKQTGVLWSTRANPIQPP